LRFDAGCAHLQSPARCRALYSLTKEIKTMGKDKEKDKDKKKDKDKDHKKDKGKDKKSSNKALMKGFRKLGKFAYTLIVLAVILVGALYAYQKGWFQKAGEKVQELYQKYTHKPDAALEAIVKAAVPVAKVERADAPPLSLPVIAVEPKGTFVTGAFLSVSAPNVVVSLTVKEQLVQLKPSESSTPLLSTFSLGDVPYDNATFPLGAVAPKVKDPVFLVSFSDDGQQQLVPAFIAEVGVTEGDLKVFTVDIDVKAHNKQPVAIINKDNKLLGVVVAPAEIKGESARVKALPYPVVR
jgi:hypothetical protein